MIPYGDIAALESAIGPNTAAFLFEPIQGEAGIRIPPHGFIQEARDLCSRHHILLTADEIQTGFGRTGRPFACDWENVVPDIYIMGKALGGGVFPSLRLPQTRIYLVSLIRDRMAPHSAGIRLAAR